MQPSGVGSLISEYLLANIWKGRNFQGVTCVGQLCPTGRLPLSPGLRDKIESLNCFLFYALRRHPPPLNPAFPTSLKGHLKRHPTPGNDVITSLGVPHMVLLVQSVARNSTRREHS